MSGAKHPPGTFCWAELSTTDAAGAKNFYTSLMGWETEDDPIPGGGTYTMIRLGGGNVGGLYELSPEMRSQGVPPQWLAYISVEDAAATATEAAKAGARIVKDAFDVFDIGRMAILRDPAGAVFAVWQPKKQTGADFTDGRPGTLCWCELVTRDSDQAATFYGEIFSWKPVVKEFGPQKYTVFMTGAEQVGGMLQMTEEWGELPSHWMVYFSVADCDVTAEEAERLDGRISVPPTEVPAVGRVAVIRDPQGAVFSVIRLEGEAA